MKVIVILALLSVAFCETAAIAESIPNSESHIEQVSTTTETIERKLGQIIVEEEKKTKKKSSAKIPVKKQQKPVDPHTIYLSKIDGIINEFGLDKKLDKQKVDSYFKKLEDKIYNSLRRSLFKQRKYMKSYETVVRHYKDIAQKYNIK